MGQGLEAGLWDLLSALFAGAVRAGLDLGERPVDVGDGRPGLGGQNEVHLPVHVGGAALATLLVELHISGLVFEGQAVGFSFQFLGLAGVAGAFLKQ